MIKKTLFLLLSAAVLLSLVLLLLSLTTDSDGEIENSSINLSYPCKGVLDESVLSLNKKQKKHGATPSCQSDPFPLF